MNTEQVAPQVTAAGSEQVAGEITVDGIALAPDFGVEITAGPPRIVWLTYQGKRAGRLATSQILFEGDGWSMQCGGDGKGVYRGHKPLDG